MSQSPLKTAAWLRFFIGANLAGLALFHQCRINRHVGVGRIGA